MGESTVDYNEKFYYKNLAGGIETELGSDPSYSIVTGRPLHLSMAPIGEDLEIASMYWKVHKSKTLFESPAHIIKPLPLNGETSKTPKIVGGILWSRKLYVLISEDAKDEKIQYIYVLCV